MFDSVSEDFSKVLIFVSVVHAHFHRYADVIAFFYVDLVYVCARDGGFVSSRLSLCRDIEFNPITSIEPRSLSGLSSLVLV